MAPTVRRGNLTVIPGESARNLCCSIGLRARAIPRFRKEIVKYISNSRKSQGCRRAVLHVGKEKNPATLSSCTHADTHAHRHTRRPFSGSSGEMKEKKYGDRKRSLCFSCWLWRSCVCVSAQALFALVCFSRGPIRSRQSGAGLVCTEVRRAGLVPTRVWTGELRRESSSYKEVSAALGLGISLLDEAFVQGMSGARRRAHLGIRRRNDINFTLVPSRRASIFGIGKLGPLPRGGPEVL
jgi:hypothetical protein